MWPDAVMQGITAAQAMVGKPQDYPGTLLITGSQFFGTTVVSCKPSTEQNNLHEIINTNKNYSHKFFVDANKHLKGFIMVGNIENVGKLRKLLQDKDATFNLNNFS